jgi:hypothetical protein
MTVAAASTETLTEKQDAAEGTLDAPASKWVSVLDEIDAALALPVEEPFTEPVFPADIGDLPVELAERANTALAGITARMAATEELATETLADLSWTRDRIADLPSDRGQPIYLDVTA